MKEPDVLAIKYIIFIYVFCSTMATAATFDVDIESGTVHIQDLTIHDAELVSFLGELEDDRIEEAVTE